MTSFRSSARALAAVCLLTLAVSGTSSAAPTRTWFMTNNIACSGNLCGPPNEMREGSGNGTFPSGFAVVRDGESRIWIARAAERSGTFGVRTWQLTPGGSSAITRATWTVGAWSWSQGFMRARGNETVITSSGPSTFKPSASFKVSAGSFVAIRVTGAAGNGLANSIDIYDEAGGSSPSNLTLR